MAPAYGPLVDGTPVVKPAEATLPSRGKEVAYRSAARGLDIHPLRKPVAALLWRQFDESAPVHRAPGARQLRS